MPSFCSVTPIPHECRIFRATVFDESTSIRSIRPEHHGAIIQKDRSLSSLNPVAKCLMIDTGVTPPDEKRINDIHLSAAFSLNVITKKNPVQFEKSFVIRSDRSFKVTQVQTLKCTGLRPTPGKYEIQESSTLAELKAIYSATLNALQQDQKIALSLRRFNISLSRETLDEKAIDMAICLESIFGMENEISFRFSLYNTLLTEPNPAERATRFKTLKDFYKIRSQIVHGSRDANEAWLESNWPTIVQIARLALLAKIDYLQNNPPNSWQSHLDTLALAAT